MSAHHSDFNRDDDDDPLEAAPFAEFLGIAVGTMWRQVAAGELPSPFYPAPRAPRWTKGDARRARERLRSLPADAKARRRAKRLAELTSET